MPCHRTATACEWFSQAESDGPSSTSRCPLILSFDTCVAKLANSTGARPKRCPKTITPIRLLIASSQYASNFGSHMMFCVLDQMPKRVTVLHRFAGHHGCRNDASRRACSKLRQMHSQLCEGSICCFSTGSAGKPASKDEAHGDRTTVGGSVRQPYRCVLSVRSIALQRHQRCACR